MWSSSSTDYDVLLHDSITYFFNASIFIGKLQLQQKEEISERATAPSDIEKRRKKGENRCLFWQVHPRQAGQKFGGNNWWQPATGALPSSVFQINEGLLFWQQWQCNPRFAKSDVNCMFIIWVCWKMCLIWGSKNVRKSEWQGDANWRAAFACNKPEELPMTATRSLPT